MTSDLGGVRSNISFNLQMQHVAFHLGEFNMLLSIKREEAWEWGEEVEENHIDTFGHGVRAHWMSDDIAAATLGTVAPCARAARRRSSVVHKNLQRPSREVSADVWDAVLHCMEESRQFDPASLSTRLLAALVDWVCLVARLFRLPLLLLLAGARGWWCLIGGFALSLGTMALCWAQSRSPGLAITSIKLVRNPTGAHRAPGEPLFARCWSIQVGPPLSRSH